MHHHHGVFSIQHASYRVCSDLTFHWLGIKTLDSLPGICMTAVEDFKPFFISSLHHVLELSCLRLLVLDQSYFTTSWTGAMYMLQRNVIIIIGLCIFFTQCQAINFRLVSTVDYQYWLCKRTQSQIKTRLVCVVEHTSTVYGFMLSTSGCGRCWSS